MGVERDPPDGPGVITRGTISRTRLHARLEIQRLGADNRELRAITAVVHGVRRLRVRTSWRPTFAPRPALVIAGLVAEGENPHRPYLSPRPRVRVHRGELAAAWRAASGALPEAANALKNKVFRGLLR